MFDELKRKLMDELARYNERELTMASLDTVNKLAHTLKCLVKIEDHKPEESNTVAEALRAMMDCASSDKEREDIRKALEVVTN